MSVIGGRTEASEGIVTDEIHRPLTSTGVDVYQERGVARHGNEVRVSLHSGHERGVRQGAIEIRGRSLLSRVVPRLGNVLRGPFTNKDFGSFAVVVVVLARHRHHLPGAGVIMLIDHVGFAGGDREFDSEPVLSTGCRDNVHLGIFPFNGVVKLGETPFV